MQHFPFRNFHKFPSCFFFSFSSIYWFPKFISLMQIPFVLRKAKFSGSSKGVRENISYYVLPIIIL